MDAFFGTGCRSMTLKPCVNLRTLGRLIREVRAVITVSQFSKERIVGLTGVERERVHVIRNGVDRRFRPADLKGIEQVETDYELTRPVYFSAPHYR